MEQVLAIISGNWKNKMSDIRYPGRSYQEGGALTQQQGDAICV